MAMATVTELPWFKDGLRFKCTECGQCCTGTSGFVWVTLEEIAEMAGLLKMTVSAFKKKYVKSRNNRFLLIEKKVSNLQYDCIFLKDKKCQVYQARPQQCRTFPWWAENVRTEESWHSVAKECEGINAEAPITPYSQIIQIMSSKEKKQG